MNAQDQTEPEGQQPSQTQTVTFNCDRPITPAFHSALQAAVDMGTRGVALFHHEQAKRLLDESEHMLIDYGALGDNESHCGEFIDGDLYDLGRVIASARLAKEHIDHLITTLEGARAALKGEPSAEGEAEEGGEA